MQWKVVLGVSVVVFLLVVLAIYQIREFDHPRNVVNKKRHSVPKQQWDYYPPDRTPMYGIVMGTTSEKFIGPNAARNRISTCIAAIYARRHNYAFALVENLELINNRSYERCDRFPQWNKIKVLQMFLHDVPVLMWVDMDAIITQLNTPLDSILPGVMLQSTCHSFEDLSDLGSGLSPNATFELQSLGGDIEPFLWVSMDLFPTYTLNINTAVIAVRRSEVARQFLQMVWEAGEDGAGFKRHDDKWHKKPLCKGYYGWPWEQGGVWDVLLSSPRLLRSTCVLPNRGSAALNSIQDNWKDTPVGSSRPFITHKPDVSMDKFLQSWATSFAVDGTTVRHACAGEVAHFLDY